MIVARQVPHEIAVRFAGYPAKFRRQFMPWVSDRVDRMPENLRRAVVSKWLKQASYKTESEKNRNLANANRSLLAVSGRISPAGLAMASDDLAVCEKAKEQANKCELYRLELLQDGLSVAEQYNQLSNIAARAGIESPEIKAGVTVQGSVNRMCAAKWWRSQLRATHKRWIEAACIQFGTVRRGQSLYVSPDCLVARKSQRARNDSALSAMVAECVETGEKISLKEAVDASVSNPSHRRDEMMLRMHGMQQWAEAEGYSCTFITRTCPSRMHACSTKGREIFDNPKYDGTTPREAAQYLAKSWGQARAEMNRQGITIFGVRVSEPHHDGTPHWHMLIYGTESDIITAEFILWAYSCRENYGEWLSNSKRISVMAKSKRDAVRFDSKRLVWEYDADGNLIKSPVSYVAKYIAKNLETDGVQTANEGKLSDHASDEAPDVKLADAVARVDAWRSCWGIKQFAFFGSHAVTIWRELRGIKGDIEEGQRVIDIDGNCIRCLTKEEKCFSDWPSEPELWRAWYAANKHEYKSEKGEKLVDAASWHNFMRALDDMPLLRLATEPAEHENSYGEIKEDAIVGLVDESTGLFQPTRLKTWVVGQGSVEPLTIERGDSSAPWSPSNNCTGVSSSAVIGGGKNRRHAPQNEYDRW